MRKFRFHCHLDEALFALVILAGGVVAAVLDVQAVSGAIASGRYGLGVATAAVAAAPLPTPLAPASASARIQQTVVARLSR